MIQSSLPSLVLKKIIKKKKIMYHLACTKSQNDTHFICLQKQNSDQFNLANLSTLIVSNWLVLLENPHLLSCDDLYKCMSFPNLSVKQFQLTALSKASVKEKRRL